VWKRKMMINPEKKKGKREVSQKNKMLMKMCVGHYSHESTFKRGKEKKGN